MNITMQIKLNKISLIPAESSKNSAKITVLSLFLGDSYISPDALCTFLHAFNVHEANQFYLFKEHVHSIKVSKYFKTPI